mmetsp:Transcript_100305/g.243983  ORF Transcript_100305/g.243983 Transcript_100305/m.243983 type:complete len:184 (+) Transcript_100305:3-554(+)
MPRRVLGLAAALAAWARAAEAASASLDQPLSALRSPRPAVAVQGQALVNASAEDPWLGRAFEQIGAALSESPLSTSAAVARKLLGTPEGEVGHLEASLLSLGAVSSQEPPRSAEGHHRHRHRGVAGRATSNPQLKGHMYGGLPWVFIAPVVVGIGTVILVHIVSLWSEYTHVKGASLPDEVDD